MKASFIACAFLILASSQQSLAKGPVLATEYFCDGAVPLAISKTEHGYRIRYNSRFYFDAAIPGAEILGFVPCINATAISTEGSLRMNYKGVCSADRIGGTLNVFDPSDKSELRIEFLVAKKEGAIEHTYKSSVFREGKAIEVPVAEKKVCVKAF